MYILLLLFMVFYLYGVFGVNSFGPNDRLHFGSLDVAMLTLFRCATLEDWTDVMYIAIYSCAAPPYGHGGSFVTAAQQTPDNRLYWCRRPDGTQPITAVAYFLSFTLIAAMCMLSLFVGAITMAMAEEMDKIKGSQVTCHVCHASSECRVHISWKVAFPSSIARVWVASSTSRCVCRGGRGEGGAR